jgi:hypothetical protein
MIQNSNSVIVGLVVALRFISRFYVTKWPGKDDWFMLSALVGT